MTLEELEVLVLALATQVAMLQARLDAPEQEREDQAAAAFMRYRASVRKSREG